MRPLLKSLAALFLLVVPPPAAFAQDGPEKKPAKPNIILILADDMGFSDVGCYGGEDATPHLDALAARGVRLTQFYNGARCCPSRAALLTGLYAHQAGVGHMLQQWRKPAYANGLAENCATIAELLRPAGYRAYHVGKWHVGGAGPKSNHRNHPVNRGFHRSWGTAGGGDFYKLQPLYDGLEFIQPGPDFYATDAFTEHATRFIEDHAREHADKPFFLYLAYTAPHFPLQAKPEDVAKFRGKYKDGWDALRERRFAKQKALGILPENAALSPRDPVAKAWEDVPEAERDEWDLRFAVHTAMIYRMDQGIGRVLETARRAGMEENTMVVFLSDNGASAEFLDTWPNPERGHKPGTVTGEPESHRTLEIGWANAANTPFRENKMWAHEGGISTPFIVSWPAGIAARGELRREVAHLIDVLPTFLEAAGAEYPASLEGRTLTPPEGRSLLPVFAGKAPEEFQTRELAWEHEGNRAIRVGDWKLVAAWKQDWELYDMKNDRTETRNLAAKHPEKVKELAARWQRWADRVGVVPWEELPGSSYKPTNVYSRKSEPAAEEAR